MGTAKAAMTSRERFRFLAELVEDSVARYLSGAASLGDLSFDLESLSESFTEVVDLSWVEQFRTTWGEIEIVNAVNQERERTDLTKDQDRRIHEAIEELLAQIRSL